MPPSPLWGAPEPDVPSPLYATSAGFSAPPGAWDGAVWAQHEPEPPRASALFAPDPDGAGGYADIAGNSREARAAAGLVNGPVGALDLFGRSLGGKADIRDPNTGGFTPDAYEAAGALAGLGMTGGIGTPVRAAAGEQVLGAGPIRAYHGSPHDFERFDLSKIGTGEGAQAYGHGLYFAENEGVARGYRDALSRDARPIGISDSAHDVAQYWLKEANGNREAAAKALIDYAGNDPRMLEIADYIRKPPGRMYEVDIHADPAKMIDYDAPLKEQPSVVRQMLGAGLPDPRQVRPRDIELRNVIDRAARQADRPSDIPLIIDNDQALYNTAERLGRRAGKDMDELSPGEFVASAAAPYLKALEGHAVSGDDLLRLYRGREGELAKAGIPGIRYLDAGSRGTNAASSNYVVLNDKLIEILRKYGLLGPVAGGAVAASPIFAPQDARAAQQ